MNHKFRGIFKVPFSLGVLCAAALFLAGCSVTRKDFTLVSTLENSVSTQAKTSNNRVSAKICSHYMPLVINSPDKQIDEYGAVQATLKKANQLGYRSNALANVEIRYTFFAIPIFYAKFCTIAEGNPINVEAY